MGNATSWIAVEGASKADVDKALGKPWIAQPMNGWILTSRGFYGDGVVADRELLAKISARWHIVAGDSESHIMFAAASEWQKGKEIWALIHVGDREPVGHEVRGTPPNGWKKLRDKAVASAKKDPDVDHLYGVPSQVASLIVGFSLDDDE